MDPLCELGFYALAGHSATPRDLVTEVAAAEAIGIGSVFVSERFNCKEAGALCGAAAAVSDRIGIATAVTNHNTRHPMLTATLAATVHRMSGGRFALGLGRGFGPLFDVMGLERVTMAQLADFAAIMRRLWKGETIFGHDGPAGRYPYLHLDAGLDEDIPLVMAAIGERTLEFAGRHFDGVVLHTFFTDETLGNSVAAVRRGAEAAGRDPASVRIWSVLATVHDGVDADLRLGKLVGRMATYLQAYGDLLVAVNRWDPAVLERFRADPVVRSFRGPIDAHADTDQLEAIAPLIPPEWLAASATGTPQQCATTVAGQLDRGADAVIMHGATPAELAPVVEAYRAVRPAGLGTRTDTNPGR